MANILIIDDEQMVGDVLSRHFENEGHQVSYQPLLTKGVDAARSHDYDIILLDVQLPDGNGLEALPHLNNLTDKPEIIIITGKGDPDGAELAIKSGAWDYIEKPFTLEQISLILNRAMQYRREKHHWSSPVTVRRKGIVGQSAALQASLDLVGQAAASDANVLICGETGTGKELFAKAVHDNSRRRKEPFVAVDCTAIPESLVESVLFGHQKGAYTGAHRDRVGLIQKAHRGTLFLDEIGDLPSPMQAGFLRVLQERKFRPLGHTTEIQSAFRLICATNRQLNEMVAADLFRADLLYRIQAFTIYLPPLHERLEDIPDLVNHYVNQICDVSGAPAKEVSVEVIEKLAQYPWPGNVRELEHTLQAAIAAAQGERVLFFKHLPLSLRVHLVRHAVTPRTDSATVQKQSIQSKQRLSLKAFRKQAADRAEGDYLKTLIQNHKGDIKAICQTAAISRSRYYELLKKHRLPT